MAISSSDSVIRGVNGLYLLHRGAYTSNIKSALAFVTRAEGFDVLLMLEARDLSQVVTVDKGYEMDNYPDGLELQNSKFEDHKNEGFICGAWKKTRDVDGIYVMRCDRPMNHKHDHCDSILLTNWHNTFDSLPNPRGE